VKAAASTALPQPPKTNQQVPINSASNFFVKGITVDPLDIQGRD
jgi:hypothetical protein